MAASKSGRAVKTNRGIGSGGKTSTSKPGSLQGFKKSGGDGMGSKGTTGSKVSVSKGKMPKGKSY